jgi:4-hydroxybenzoate polyprenyltransferase
VTERPSRGRWAEFGRYLEIQNLGLNLPFAIGFLLLAAGGLPPLRPLALILVAFVAARNAGHSFNRWADRTYDAANPRTQDRALVTGRYPPSFALAFATGNAALLVIAAWLLNPLSFGLSFLALALVFGYSYSKRYSALTTPFLGLVEAITPAAVYIGLDGRLPADVLLAVLGMLLWGTAFESIHSLGDVGSDRTLGLRSLPIRVGVRASLNLIVVFHVGALAALAGFGALIHVGVSYFVGLGVMGIVAGVTDWQLRIAPQATLGPFRRHFILSALFLLGVLGALWGPLAWHA